MINGLDGHQRRLQKELKYTEIGRKHRIDPRTAKRYAEVEIKPKYELSKKCGSILDKYKQTIYKLIKEASFIAVRIQEIIAE